MDRLHNEHHESQRHPRAVTGIRAASLGSRKTRAFSGQVHLFSAAHLHDLYNLQYMRHKLLTYVCLIFVLFTSCRKEYDHPPYTTIAEGEYITVTQLRERVPVTSSLYRFNSGDTSLNFTLIADETTGSFYSCIYARDDEHTAIRLNLKESGGLYTGDRIRLNLNGLTVRHANNVYSIDSVDIARNVVKLSSGNKVAPKTVTMHQLLQSLSAGGTDLQSDLVQLEDVEFLHDHR